MSMLTVNNVHTYYGSIHALRGINLTIEQGEIVTLIGGNGAGKTTTLRTISGLLKPAQGEITLEGDDLLRYKPHEIVYKGLSMVPEGRGVFARMSVLENLEMGAFSRNNKQEIARNLDHVMTLFPRLKERRTQLAGTLSGGEQQMLATGRALMAEPRILLLDEPSMGLAPVLVELIFDTIVQPDIQCRIYYVSCHGRIRHCANRRRTCCSRWRRPHCICSGSQPSEESSFPGSYGGREAPSQAAGPRPSGDAKEAGRHAQNCQ